MAYGKHVEFRKEQTHVKAFELGMLIFSIVCVVVVLIIVLGTDIGNEFRPKV